MLLLTILSRASILITRKTDAAVAPTILPVNGRTFVKLCGFFFRFIIMGLCGQCKGEMSAHAHSAVWILVHVPMCMSGRY